MQDLQQTGKHAGVAETCLIFDSFSVRQTSQHDCSCAANSPSHSSSSGHIALLSSQASKIHSALLNHGAGPEVSAQH